MEILVRHTSGLSQTI
jgi:hypothetical protein